MRRKLQAVEFEIWNSIVEHKAADAPDIIIDELDRAHRHLMDAMRVLVRMGSDVVDR